MYTRDEYNTEILKIARRTIEAAPAADMSVWPLLSSVEAAVNCACLGGSLADYDQAVDAVRTALREYVAQSELPEAVERPADELPSEVVRTGVEYEIYRVCTRGPKRGRGIGICAHTAGVEIYVDYATEVETVRRIAQRIRDDSTPGRCQMVPMVYEVTKLYRRASGF